MTTTTDVLPGMCGALGCPHGDEIPRDRWGRPVIEGEPYTRVSTLAGTLSDQGALIAWKARMALLGATPALLRQAQDARPNKAAVDAVVESALERAGAGDAATEGTRMHEVLTGYAMAPDAFDWGAVDDLTAASVVAFSDVLRQHRLTATAAEQFVAGSRGEHRWAGTFDLALTDEAGNTYLADIKTSAALWDRKYPLKVAVQLAAYALAQRWCPREGFLPTPPWDGLVLISVPLDTGDAHLDFLDNATAVQAFDLALAVRAMRGRKDLLRSTASE